MIEKEAIIIEEIYLIESSLKEKTLNYFLDKYYNGKTLEKLQPFQREKILK